MDKQLTLNEINKMMQQRKMDMERLIEELHSVSGVAINENQNTRKNRLTSEEENSRLTNKYCEEIEYNISSIVPLEETEKWEELVNRYRAAVISASNHQMTGTQFRQEIANIHKEMEAFIYSTIDIATNI